MIRGILQGLAVLLPRPFQIFLGKSDFSGDKMGFEKALMNILAFRFCRFGRAQVLLKHFARIGS